MVTITKPEPIIRVNITRDWTPKMKISFKPELVTLDPSHLKDQWMHVELDKHQVTQLLAAMKSQRKRKAFKDGK